MPERASAPCLTFGDVGIFDETERPIRIWLLSAKELDGKTHYRLAGRFFKDEKQTWHVHRRYSAFLTLRQSLIKYFADAPTCCPGCLNYLHALEVFEFPKKHLFASKTPLVINYRLKALRSFINMLSFWTFSDTPKCPTCAGDAFELVCNFLLEDAEASEGCDMQNIQSLMDIKTFAPEKIRKAEKSSIHEQPLVVQHRSQNKYPSNSNKSERKELNPYKHFDDYLPSQMKKSVRRATYAQDCIDINALTKGDSAAIADANSNSLHGTFLFYNDDTSLSRSNQNGSSISTQSNTANTSKRGILKAPGSIPDCVANSFMSESHFSDNAANKNLNESRHSRKPSNGSASILYPQSESRPTADSRRASKAGEGLWQPWELAKA